MILINYLKFIFSQQLLFIDMSCIRLLGLGIFKVILGLCDGGATDDC